MKFATYRLLRASDHFTFARVSMRMSMLCHVVLKNLHRNEGTMRHFEHVDLINRTFSSVRLLIGLDFRRGLEFPGVSVMKIVAVTLDVPGVWTRALS